MASPVDDGEKMLENDVLRLIELSGKKYIETDVASRCVVTGSCGIAIY